MNKKNRLMEIVKGLEEEERSYNEVSSNNKLKLNTDSSETIYCTEKWVGKETDPNKRRYSNYKNCLIFDFDNTTVEALSKSAEGNLILVRHGNAFKEIDTHNLEINLMDETSFLMLNKWLKKNNIEIDCIINCFCANKDIPESQNFDLLDYTAYWLFYLAKHVLLGKSCELFFFYINKNNKWNATCASIGSFFRVLANENSRISCHCVEIGSKKEITTELIIKERDNKDFEVRYENNKRLVKKLELAKLTDSQDTLLVNGGTYIVIGGLGGLGRVTAIHLITKFHANVIVCGRNNNSELTQDIKSELSEKGADHNKFSFIPCDITNINETNSLISSISKKVRKVNGIVHCAGAMKDAMIAKKEKNDFDQVINPKINSIDQVMTIAKAFNSDFIFYFSSISAYVGTLGQCDYAYANGFINNYASSQQDTKPIIISTAWPLWDSKGMQAEKQLLENMEKSGFSILTQQQGMLAFEKILSNGRTGTYMVLQGKKEAILSSFGLKNVDKEIGENHMKNKVNYDINEEKDNVLSNIYLFVKGAIASITKHKPEDIDDYEYFDNLGIDSIKMIDIINAMEEKVSSLPKTLFFEYQSINQLAEYLYNNYQELFIQSSYSEKDVSYVEDNMDMHIEQHLFENQNNLEHYVNKDNSEDKFSQEPIAIIGYDGKFPKAENVQEYWEILSQGLDCIIEVPKERWDYNSFYSQDVKKPGMTNCKWGGFLEKPEYFDAEFFNYSPIEATMIDPQERIFLETVWNTMENAGYTRNKLKDETVGVYVGVAWGHYQFYETKLEDYTLSPVSSFSSIANRVSYFLDLKGPSIAIDTMCSSSGTAIHLACESIHRGESTVAFAGGVNLSVHPTKYKVLSTKNYLSSEGKCRSFGEDGDGYVPGEGVGALLLKPLSKAISDGDHIEAVILATGVNHGGKTTGYSVPSPNAQGELIKKTVEKANIKPTDISYIEAHGTGTSLGDPIEILGLSKGLDINNNMSNYVIGSVKSNIGHLESSAAVAGLIKVMLQMKNNMIVPSLHSENLNKEIDFDKLPFKVAQQLQPWKSKKEHKGSNIELYSAVSSFGAGGSNSFMVLGKLADNEDRRTFQVREQVVVVSAQTEQSLKSYILKLSEFINNIGSENNSSFIDLCYTLQVCREEMPYRVAFVASSTKQLQEKLTQYIDGVTVENSYYGMVEKKALAKTYKAMSSDIASFASNRKFDELANAWVNGKYVDWDVFYKNEAFRPKKVALPTYCFQKSKYWILDYNNDASRKVNVDLIHPMIDTNCSTIDRQMYTKKFFGTEVYLANHIVNNRIIMPGAAYLELSRAASQLALKDICTVTSLKNITFQKPLIIDEDPVDIVIECYPKKGGVSFEVKKEKDKDSEEIFCKGEVSYLGYKNYFDEDLKYTDNDLEATVDIKKLYNMLKEAGFAYGDYYQCIQKITVTDDTVIAKLSISENIANENSFYVLKPSLIDSALQSTSLLLSNTEEGSKFIPSKIETIKICREMTNDCTVVAKLISKSETNYMFDIKIYDDKGNMCIQICNYTIEAYDIYKKEAKKDVGSRIISVREDENKIKEKVRDFVKHAISKETGVDTYSIKEIDDFEKYGIDSVMTIKITERLNKVFNSLPATLLFEYKSVGSLIEHILTEYYETAVKHYGNGEAATTLEENKNDKKEVLRDDRKSGKKTTKGAIGSFFDDVAIIGVSGRYPQADNLEEFWDVLVNGKDCVTEIPIDRWDYRTLYSPDKNEKGKISSKWGGFINGAEEFDADFFGIVPIQAAIMDPQERIYLQTAWGCIEDAGYTVKALENYSVGVYTGEMWGCYQKIGVEETLKGNIMSLSSSFASTSNKISYIMNLHGPSMTVDTMCSSSLTAIHLACKAISEGSIDMAIAGGVNLSLHPDKYLSLSQGKFLSSNGKCSSFGEGGDGYVPGEGVGTVLLKRLSDAERDGDHIYAIIKATAINHGGRSNAYFVPNVAEQKNLIVEALKNADISPRTISSVEAHGTGTALGDPIEIQGFNKAYRNYTQDNQYCSIGSVKSNIGHLESAAGIAALTKMILEMKHKKLVPSLHSKVLNSKIDFENSPFYVQQEYSDWNKPIIGEQGQQVEYPRRGAISAFGAGGTNVHIILEEYEEVDTRHIEEQERLIILSAKNQERLKEIVQNFIEFLKKKDFKNKLEENRFMSDLSHTLLFGREQFNCRIALVASKADDLLDKLEDYLTNHEANGVFAGNTKNSKIENELFEDEEGKYYLNALLRKRNLQKICKLWISGVEFEFSLLLSEQYKKITLPSYPFEKNVIKPPKVKLEANKVALHSMIDDNISTIMNQRFVKQFNGKEFYLQDHIINGKSILPAAAYLEMIRAAGELSVQDGVVSKIKNIVWQRPLMVDNVKVEAYINLNPKEDEITCQVETIGQMGTHLVHCEGTVELVKYNPRWKSQEIIDLKAYKEACNITIYGKDFYEEFSKNHFNYGKRLQFIQKILISEVENCAVMVLEEASNLFDKDKYTLHPAILDSGIQAVATLINDETKSYLPYSIGEIEILDTSDAPSYVVIEKQDKTEDTITFDLTYTNKDGKVLLKFSSLSVKEQKSNEKEQAIKYFTTEIIDAKPLPKSNEKTRFIILDTSTKLFNSLKQTKANVVLGIASQNRNKLSESEYEFCPSEEQDYKWLFDEINLSSQSNCIIYNLNDIDHMDIDLNHATGFFKFIKALISNGVKKSTKVFNIFGGNISSKDQMQINPMYLACAGIFKTAVMESTNLFFKNIAVDNSILQNSSLLAENLLEELTFDKENVAEIYYSSQNNKYGRGLKELSLNNQQSVQNSPIKQDGVYLITGGLKGVGYIFAEYLAKTYKTNIVLLGRSELSIESENKINKLKKACKSVLYLQADVNELQDMKNAVEIIKNKYGHIDGVIHSAGIKQDEMIINKSPDTFKNVITTKTVGLQNICKAIDKDNIDFIVTFSSLAGLMGNIGQSDYAYANNYMDSYASIEGNSGRRIISINWPYWLNGGMRLKDAEIESMKKRNGMVPLATAEGLRAFEYAIANVHLMHQLFVLALENEPINDIPKETIDKKPEKAKVKEDKKKIQKDGGSKKSTSEAAEKYLKQVISEETQIATNKINNDEVFENFGIDSVMIMNITANIEKDFGALPKTLLYENHTINELCDYLQKNNNEKYYELFGQTEQNEAEEIDVVEEVHEKDDEFDYTATREKITFSSNFTSPKTINPVNSTTEQDDIAIVGMIIKAPEADNIEEYWNNLVQNKNCIKEVPQERWDYKPYYSAKKGEIGKTYCKHGGFINNVDKFDPLFFNIAPNNAAFIEPQERMLLQEVWHLFENAGYSVSALEKRDIGVFVGAMWQQYQMMLMNGPAQGMIPSLFSNLSNRISSYYNLSGPSISLDTMCSASLTALHLAINSIKNGECSSAIVAGVNTSLHPSKYINLSQGGLLSTDSRCKPFGKGADGYIPSEGLGIVLIKSLSQAIADNDNIYMVIKSSSIVHSGKGGGFMTPNPKAQATVMENAIKKANVPIESIGYIETQGTCTEVGDAIEVRGMSDAFNKFSNKYQTCAIGSAKYSIGHTESASGMHAIAKIAMQMKHHMIPGLLTDDEINEELKLETSPFYIAQNTCKWKPYEANGKVYPLTAGLNGFGGGGTYLHLVLEEYKEMSEKKKQNKVQPNAFILSAKNKKSLKQMIINFQDFLETNYCAENNEQQVYKIIANIIGKTVGIQETNINKESLMCELNLSNKDYVELPSAINKEFNLKLEYEDFINFKTIQDIINNVCGKVTIVDSAKLEQIAYSLQTTRDSMSERVAFVAQTAEELLIAINDSLANDNSSGIFSGIQDIKTCDTNLISYVEKWIGGEEVNWKALYTKPYPKKVRLPEYPFAMDSYWLPKEMIVNYGTNMCKSIPDIGEVNNVEGDANSFQEYGNREKIALIIANCLGISVTELDYNISLKDYGLDSYLGTKAIQEIAELVNQPINIGILEECDTVNKLYDSVFANKEVILESKAENKDMELKTVENTELTKLLLMQLEKGEISVEDAIKIENDL